MALELIGRNGGSWTIDIDLVQEKSYVISCGLSHEISFDLEMIKLKQCKVIGIDPTNLSVQTISNYRSNRILNDDNYVFIEKALYDQSGKEMTIEDYMSVFHKGSKKIQTITLEDIIHQFNDRPISVIKMDIEASEYPVIYSLKKLEAMQVCIEFHHWLKNIPYTLKDSINCISIIKGLGYKLVYKKVHVKKYDEDPLDELLFIKNEFASNYTDIEIC